MTKGIRPAAMLFDYLVNFTHDSNGFAEGNNDLLVMADILFRQNAAGMRALRIGAK